MSIGLIVAILFAGALLAALLPNRLSGPVALASSLVAGALSVWLAAGVLTGEPVVERWGLALPNGLPASLTLRVDGLSAIYLLLLGLLPPLALLFAQSYIAGKRFYAPLLCLIGSMVLVVTAADWVLFLFAWELMTLSSYLLVLWDWGVERHTRSAWAYLLTTHVTSSGIIIAISALSLIGGDFSFATTAQALAETLQRLPAFGHLLVGCFVLGFATKAAVWPLSYWLPEAYRSAPSPATALFSGLMAKMGIYGLIRVLVFMLPGGTQEALVWGLVVATLGAASMVVGNIRSMSELDAKRLVAQSSIGQIGYITLGLGMAVALSGRAPALSALAFAGALFHLVNHTTFKSLLFLTVGAIERRARTFDLRKLGGLITAMPGAAALTLLAALAIAGTPPLNGFASKWLLYRAAVFGGLELPLLAVYGVIAIFISTVSLAAYLKYFGTVFLGAQRADLPVDASPEPVTMTAAMAILGGACVALGLWPAPVVAGAMRALSQAPDSLLWGAGSTGTSDLLGSVLGSGGYQPLAVLAGLALSALVIWVVWQFGNQEVRATTPWFGGEELTPGEARYGAEHLYKPFLARYAALLRSWWEPRFHAPSAIERAIDADHWLIRPVFRAYDWFTALAGNGHRGQPRGYAAWQLAALLIVIGLLISAEGGLF